MDDEAAQHFYASRLQLGAVDAAIRCDPYGTSRRVAGPYTTVTAMRSHPRNRSWAGCPPRHQRPRQRRGKPRSARVLAVQAAERHALGVHSTAVHGCVHGPRGVRAYLSKRLQSHGGRHAVQRRAWQLLPNHRPGPRRVSSATMRRGQSSWRAPANRATGERRGLPAVWIAGAASSGRRLRGQVGARLDAWTCRAVRRPQHPSVACLSRTGWWCGQCKLIASTRACGCRDTPTTVDSDNSLGQRAQCQDARASVVGGFLF
jgi:hypothetical protein